MRWKKRRRMGAGLRRTRDGALGKTGRSAAFRRQSGDGKLPRLSYGSAVAPSGGHGAGGGRKRPEGNGFQRPLRRGRGAEPDGGRDRGEEGYGLVPGGRRLTGERVRASELRGGAALVVAGLCAEGDTLVENRSYVDRGYEDICRDLRFLGACVQDG